MVLSLKKAFKKCLKPVKSYYIVITVGERTASHFLISGSQNFTVV